MSLSRTGSQSIPNSRQNNPQNTFQNFQNEYQSPSTPRSSAISMGSRPTPFSLNVQQQLPSSYSTRALGSSIPNQNQLQNPQHFSQNKHQNFSQSRSTPTFGPQSYSQQNNIDTTRLSFHKQDVGNGLPLLPPSFALNLSSQGNNNTNNGQNGGSGHNTPLISPRMSFSTPSIAGNSVGNNGRGLIENNNQFVQNINPNPPQQQDLLPVIIPTQQSLQPEDPLLKSMQPALQSRKLMRTHYKSTSYCVFFIFISFLILAPLTYFIAYSSYSNESKSFTKETCTINSVEKTPYTVHTSCGESHGFRFSMTILYDGKPSPLCSSEPYACYNSTATPTPTPPGPDDELFMSNDQMVVQGGDFYQLLSQPPSSPHFSPSPSLSTLSSPSTNIELSEREPFQCTLCLRNHVEQCFSFISTSETEFDHIKIGDSIDCYEYTTVSTVTSNGEDGGTEGKEYKRLNYKYFMGDPKFLAGYPYVHGWYVFFFVGSFSFFLIALYYFIKGIGVCDIIDPEYWKHRKKVKNDQDVADRQAIDREGYFERQEAVFGEVNPGQIQNNQDKLVYTVSNSDSN
jgi:hypothetical protein